MAARPRQEAVPGHREEVFLYRRSPDGPHARHGRREVRSALVPDAFGGNMDTPEMRAGTTCYLGVNVPGALLSLGDGHARQGEGETCGVAVEGAMNKVLIVDLLNGSGS